MLEDVARNHKSWFGVRWSLRSTIVALEFFIPALLAAFIGFHFYGFSRAGTLIFGLGVLGGLLALVGTPSSLRAPPSVAPVLRDENAMSRVAVHEGFAGFGPNSAQVFAFVDRLPRLTEAHWRVVDHEIKRNHRSPLLLLRRSTNRSSEKETWAWAAGLQRQPAERAAMVAVMPFAERLKTSPVRARISIALRNATLALIYRDVLAPHQFDDLYEPFEEVIPVSTL